MKGWESENSFIEELRRRYPAANATGLLIQNGDDAAVLKASSSPLVITVDATVEGHHFDLRYFSLEQVGMKSIEVAASDVVAMGGQPRYALVSLELALTSTRERTLRLYDGIATSLKRLNMELIGGNVCSSTGGLHVHITVIGEVDIPVARDGAKEGDLIAVSGTLGNSAAGFEILRQETLSPYRAQYATLTTAHLEPRCRNDLGPRLKGKANAMMDISDGLSTDLNRLLLASGVGGVIEKSLIPISNDLRSYATHANKDPYQFALNGGEDYELLFAIPESAWDSSFGTIIGRCAGEGARLKDATGERRIVARGYDHLASSAKDS